MQPISTFEIGDYVLAYDEASGQVGYYPIIGVWMHEDSVVVHLTVDGELVETTPEHPFYTAQGEWIPAGELQVGDEIRRADGGYGSVDAVAFVQHAQTMYNFTVAGAHTYFVGDEQWLVHNSCLEKIQQSVSDAMRPHLDRIRKLAPDAQVGFRGSLARGTKGPHKGFAPFDPSDFDVDAFIVSDELAALFPPGMGVSGQIV